jgi:hypothetical protein
MDAVFLKEYDCISSCFHPTKNTAFILKNKKVPARSMNKQSLEEGKAFEGKEILEVDLPT